MSRIGVISKDTYGDYQVRDIQVNGSWKVNPYPETHVLIPDHLIDDIMKTNGFCDIELNFDGTGISSFIERKRPEIKHRVDFSIERILSKFLLQNEYRFCLLERGISIPNILEDKAEVRLFDLCKSCIACGNKEEVKSKLDVFLMYDKITLEEYQTLMNLIKE